MLFDCHRHTTLLINPWTSGLPVFDRLVRSYSKRVLYYHTANYQTRAKKPATGKRATKKKDGLTITRRSFSTRLRSDSANRLFASDFVALVRPRKRRSDLKGFFFGRCAVSLFINSLPAVSFSSQFVLYSTVENHEL